MSNEESVVARTYAQKIRSLTARADVSNRIERYLDPTEAYAAFSFDTAGANPTFDLSADDLLVLNFLDVPIGPMTYRRLMELRPEIGSMLHKLSSDAHLWHMRADNQLYDDANALWALLEGVAGIGPTRASTIMARKRPKLIPILDRWVSEFYDGRTENFWLPLAEALRDHDLRRVIDGLRPAGMDTSALSLLRILDITIWMARGRPPPKLERDNEVRR